MSDYEKQYVEFEREEAKKYMPKVAELVKQVNDPEFTAFMQRVVDSYMLHEAKLGRSRG